MTPTSGEVWVCALGGGAGSEQHGTRPVIVVSHDAFNAALPLTTVVPLTTFRRRSGVVYPSETKLPRGLANLKADSLALGHHIRTIARTRLLKRIGVLPPELMPSVEEAMRTHLRLD